MKNNIKPTNKEYHETSFDLTTTYNYEFKVDGTLEKHQLTYGFTEDLIQILSEEYAKHIRDYIKKKSITN